jgi:hypothetical protein
MKKSISVMLRYVHQCVARTFAVKQKGEPMSVIIKDMEIPKSCGDCPLNHDEMSCVVTGTRWWSDTMVLLNFDYTKERLYDCPLSEVPSAQPEIIRCGNCKHWTRTCGDEQWGLGDCDVFDKHLVMCNGYCAWAERREE